MGYKNLPGYQYNYSMKWLSGLTGIFRSTLMLILLSFSVTPLLSQIVVNGLPGDWPAVLNNGVASVKSFVHDSAQTNDDQFTQGSSDTDPIEKWRWNRGQTNNKGDILNTGVALIGHKLFFFGDRFSINGDAQIGFWFFLSDVFPKSDGTFNGSHAIGDLLILSNFTNGGGGVNIRVFKYVGTGGAFGKGQYDSIPISQGDGGAAVNSSDVAVPTNVPGWRYTSKSGPANTYVTGSFFEGFVDLDSLGANICFQDFLMETRNSQSITASQQDMAAGSFDVFPDITLNVGLKAGVTADTAASLGCPRIYTINSNQVTTVGLKATGGALSYTFTITKLNGSPIGSEVSFVTVGSDSATFTINNSLASNFIYKVRVTGSNAPGCEDKDSVCLQPSFSGITCGITGPDTVCPKSTSWWFYDPDGNGTVNPIPAGFNATWSFLSNTNGATLNAPTADKDSISVTASATCNNTGFKLQLLLVSTGGGLSVRDSCTDSATVAVDGPLTLTCPQDKDLDCGASTNPSNTGTATAPDNGCGVKLMYIDTLYRTWVAIDACGNKQTCRQVIRIDTCVVTNTLPARQSTTETITSGPTLISDIAPTNQTVKPRDIRGTLTSPNATSLNTGLSKEVQIQAFPNPFSNKVNFRFVSPVGGRAVLEIFNTQGQRVGIAFDGKVDAGVTKYVQFSTRLTNQALIYTLKIGGKVVRGTVLELKR